MVFFLSYFSLALSLSSAAHGLAVSKRAETSIYDTFADLLPRAQAFNFATSKLSPSTTPDQYWDFLAVAQEGVRINIKGVFIGALNQPTLTDTEVAKLVPVVKNTVDEFNSGIDKLTSHIKDFWTLSEDDLRLITSLTRYIIGSLRWDINTFFDRILTTYPRIPATSSALIKQQATRFYDKLWAEERDWWNVKTLPPPTNRTTPNVEPWKDVILANLERRVAISADFKDYVASLAANVTEDEIMSSLDLELMAWIPGVIQTLRELNKFDTETTQKTYSLAQKFSSNVLQALLIDEHVAIH